MPAGTAARTKSVPASAEPRPADRRARILAEASRLFAEYGFEATSVRQIADAVGILAGSLYHHFATKEDMFHAVIRAGMEQMVAGNRILADLRSDAEHRLVASVIWRFRQYVDQAEFQAILTQESRFFRRHPDFAYVVAAKGDAFRMQRAILEDGMARGLFHPGIDTYLMIGTISRMLSSAASWFRSGDLFSSDKPSRYTLDAMIDFHLDCVLRLVRAPERLAEPIPRAACERLLPGGASRG